MKKELLRESMERISLNKQIEVRKIISSIEKDARSKSKPKKCILCGEEQTSFCNSHTIPEFVLKTIGRDGYFCTGASLSINVSNKETVGLKNTITFNIICDKCDNELFQKYENPDEYDNRINNEILSEIALKNYLRTYSKRLIEKEIYTFLSKEGNIVDTKLVAIDLDINEAIQHIEYAKKKKLFYKIDEIDLDYRVPFAYQGEIYLTNGFDDKIINDIYLMDKKYKMQGLHICVFPLETKTKIILFIKDGDQRYRDFYKYYRKLSLEEKLYVINYMILIYEEDWVINPNYSFVINDMTTKDIIATYSEGFSDYYFSLYDTIKDYRLYSKGNVYNFLTKKMEST